MTITNELSNIRNLVWTGLIAALIAVGAWISIPIGLVPVTLQTMFVLLSGLLLNGRYGVFAVLLYLAAGSIGLPVFTGGKSGIATFWGPTGGYLISYILMAYITSLKNAFTGKLVFLPVLLLCLLCIVINLGTGTLVMSFVLDYSLSKAWLIGAAPFIIGDSLKAFAATAIYVYMRKYNLLPR